MPSEGLRPLTIIALNFIAGYAVVAFVTGWLRRKSPVAKRDPNRKDPRQGTARSGPPPPDEPPPRDL